MCDPVTMATLAIASTAMEFEAEKEATKFYNAGADRNNLLAGNARDLKVRQVDSETEQNLMNSAQEKLDAKLEALKAEATAEVAGSAAGIEGRSLQVIKDDFVRQGLRAETASSTEMDRYISAAALKRQGLHAEAESRLIRKKAGPSAMMYAIKAGMSAAAAYNAFTPSGPAPVVEATPI